LVNKKSTDSSLTFADFSFLQSIMSPVAWGRGFKPQFVHIFCTQTHTTIVHAIQSDLLTMMAKGNVILQKHWHKPVSSSLAWSSGSGIGVKSMQPKALSSNPPLHKTTVSALALHDNDFVKQYLSQSNVQMLAALEVPEHFPRPQTAGCLADALNLPT
jgi:hypothetical protein